jgi:hypothetical protein
MWWIKVVPSDGIGILPLICVCLSRGCTIIIYTLRKKGSPAFEEKNNLGVVERAHVFAILSGSSGLFQA